MLPDHPPPVVAKEQFFYGENKQHLELLDEAARRSGVSRGQAFEDLLQMSVCALSVGAMEEQYLAVVEKHTAGEKGRRGVDSLSELFGRIVAAMEETHDEMKDVLGDLFQGGITYGEAGQFYTPMPICRLMAQMTVGDVSEEERQQRKRVVDCCCGSGRMLLAVAEINRHWEFVGQDIDRRCVLMTAQNLAFRNLFGYVFWGNSLADEKRLVYRTGFNGRGFIREVAIGECPPAVQQAAAEPPTLPETKSDEATTIAGSDVAIPSHQLRLF